MASSSLPATVAQRFFAPLLDLLPACRHTRLCPALPDPEWLRLLVGRVLHEAPSGRAFLQEFAHLFPVSPATGAFFESLKSPRRLRFLKELNAAPQHFARRVSPDPLAQYPPPYSTPSMSSPATVIFTPPPPMIIRPTAPSTPRATSMG